jgi:hypothetical protein
MSVGYSNQTYYELLCHPVTILEIIVWCSDFPAVVVGCGQMVVNFTYAAATVE